MAGPSGSGKTSLILTITGVISNLLNGFVEGDVDLYGINPINPEDFPKVPKFVGVVLQDPEKQLVMPTPADEVSFTLENLGFTVTRESIMNSLKNVGLESRAYSPTEYLSGGEKKRLCIAASIVHKPKLLIFDEPTANLDPWGVSEVINYIKRLKKEGSSVIVIEHKARHFLPLTDKLMVLINGEQKLNLTKDLISSKYEEVVNTLNNLGVDASKPNLTRRNELYTKPVVITANDLWFRYPSSKEYVLKGVSLTLRKGEVGVVVGRNGSGKSTLLKVLSGLYKPDRGSIKVPSLNGINGKVRKRNLVFYVPQEPDYMFIHNTVLKELQSCSNKSFNFDEVPWVKEVLNESPYKLSHGQRRWLSYLIAKLHSPEVVMFDEPTAGLDIRLLKQFVNWVKDFVSEGKTVLIATHDVRVVCDIATNAFIMSEGTLSQVSVEEARDYLEKPVEVIS
ncbi:MAG: energy-coupling factor ABC transporter ATP-binding protein [Sulfolobales archaeon]|nr:energy-coupling factor ABC transporter ATP-binding protein [Sulfolobales archaeon]